MRDEHDERKSAIEDAMIRDAEDREETKQRRPVPEWLGPALAVAQHMDVKAKWPAWKQFLHWAFISWNCPCCIKQRQDRKRKLKL